MTHARTDSKFKTIVLISEIIAKKVKSSNYEISGKNARYGNMESYNMKLTA